MVVHETETELRLQVGIEAELVRTLGSSNGIASMLRDFAQLQADAAAGAATVQHVCLADVTPFVSLDSPWCFDYGLREGRNWEWPLLNASVGRDRRDALFEC